MLRKVGGQSVQIIDLQKQTINVIEEKLLS
jgi:hypothetical protein